MTHRQRMWDQLGEHDVDLLIIGGGINGAGIARDAARRGLKVALCEMNGLASGTSSRSSKLVHGGLRYLEQLEFSLVFESVSERRILTEIAPHIVNPLPFLFPVFKKSRRPLAMIRSGMWIYEGLSLFRSPKRHRTLSQKEIEKEEPALRSDNIKGAPIYYDCATDDARLTLESALDAVHVGAIVCPYAKVTGFVHDDETKRIKAVTVQDELYGGQKEVRAKVFINATGPWTDQTMSMDGTDGSQLLRPTKGVHIVVEHDKLPVNNAVVLFHPEDGRVLFAIPWGDRTYVGTTDTDDPGDPGEVAATGQDVAYLIDASNAYFPHHQIGPDDVIATWAGLRPLMSPVGDDVDVGESQVSREHQVIVGRDGLVTVAGGKLTTYRRMSEEVVEAALNYLMMTDGIPDSLTDAHTKKQPLPGAVGWPTDDNHERVAERVRAVAGGAIDATTARLLADTYGMVSIEIAGLVRDNPELAEPLIEGRPEILAQVDWAVEQELAATITDILVHRTQIFYRDLDQGLGCTTRVAKRMAELLGWEDDERDQRIAEYEAEVALSRRWRSEV